MTRLKKRRFVRAQRGMTASLTIAMLCMLAPGCASWNATGDRRTTWSVPPWKRSDAPKEPPGYDLYADNAKPAGLHADKPSTVVASTPRPSRRTQRPDPLPRPEPEALARSEANSSSDLKPELEGPKRQRENDSSIRVTLGSPETLPTLSDPGEPSGPMLASASPSAATADKRRVDEIPAARLPSSTARLSDSQVASRPRRQRTVTRQPEPAAPDRSASDAETKPLELVRQARERLEGISTYQVDITRVERVGGQLQAEEELVLGIRRKPQAVLLQWVKGPSKGREVIYSTALNDRVLHVNMANSPLPLPRMSIPVDSPMVLRSSRHPISEAGFDTIFDGLVKFSNPETADAKESGKVVYKGIEKPRGVDRPCHRLERISPKGETWEVYLDTKTLMPTLVSATQTSSGELIERYFYRNFRANPTELASADSFDPDKRWGESKGFLSRLARAAAAGNDAKPANSTTR